MEKLDNGRIVFHFISIFLKKPLKFPLKSNFEIGSAGFTPGIEGRGRPAVVCDESAAEERPLY